MLQHLLNSGYDATKEVDDFIMFEYVSSCWYCGKRVLNCDSRFMILRTEAELWSKQVPWIHETQHVVLIDLVD